MRFMLTLVAALFALPALAHDYKVGDISIMHPMSYATTGKAAAGYMVIQNAGAADRLVSVTADFPRVELHNVIMEDGIAKMRRQEGGIAIPAGGQVALEKGGFHVMFMGLTTDLKVGAEIPATLTFEKAGRVDVVFKVEARPKGASGHSHAGHGH